MEHGITVMLVQSFAGCIGNRNIFSCITAKVKRLRQPNFWCFKNFLKFQKKGSHDFQENIRITRFLEHMWFEHNFSHN